MITSKKAYSLAKGDCDAFGLLSSLTNACSTGEDEPSLKSNRTKAREFCEPTDDADGCRTKVDTIISDRGITKARDSTKIPEISLARNFCNVLDDDQAESCLDRVFTELENNPYVLANKCSGGAKGESFCKRAVEAAEGRSPTVLADVDQIHTDEALKQMDNNPYFYGALIINEDTGEPFTKFLYPDDEDDTIYTKSGLTREKRDDLLRTKKMNLSKGGICQGRSMCTEAVKERIREEEVSWIKAGGELED